MSDPVIFKFGADTSAVGRALRGLSGQIDTFRTQSIEKFKGIEEGMKWMNRANMMIGLISQFDSLMGKTRGLAKWWGAFSADGVRGVQNIGRAERELEANRQKWKAANQKRWKDEAAASKARESLAKSMRDIVFKNATDEGKLNILMRERGELFQKFIATQDGTEAFYKAQEAYLEKEQEIREQNLAIEKKKTEQAEKQKRLTAEIIDAQKAVRDAKDKKGDRSRVTMDELLSNETGGKLDVDKEKARKAADLERRADSARRNGNFKISESLLNERDKVVLGDTSSKEAVSLRARIDNVRRSGNKSVADAMETDFQNRFGGIGSLKTSERDQFTEMNETIAKSEAHLAELIKAAKESGIKIIPRMGK